MLDIKSNPSSKGIWSLLQILNPSIIKDVSSSVESNVSQKLLIYRNYYILVIFPFHLICCYYCICLYRPFLGLSLVVYSMCHYTTYTFPSNFFSKIQNWNNIQCTHTHQILFSCCHLFYLTDSAITPICILQIMPRITHTYKHNKHQQ